MISEMDQVVFYDCYVKVKDLKSTDVENLNHLIDQLNSLKLCNLRIDNKTIENLFSQIVHLLPKENDHLITKFCSLIYLFLNKQERIISIDCVQKLTEFIILALQNCGECFLSDVLIGFSALLNTNGDKTQKFFKNLLGKDGILIKLLEHDRHDKNVQYYTFQCIINLITKNTDTLTQKNCFELLYNKCMTVIKKTLEQNSSDILSIKILMSSLKCLQLLFISKNAQVDNVGELLGILKCLLFYGLPGPSVNDFMLHPTLPTPELRSIEDSQGESDSSTYPKLRKQKRVRRIKQKKMPQKKEQIIPKEDSLYNYESCDESTKLSPPSPSVERAFCDLKIKSSSSDSEYSDIESSSSRIKSHQASIRQIAYQVLQAVVKNTDKKIIFGYWSSFLPDHPAIPGMTYGQNIFTTILKDPVPQVRLGALVLLTEMLRGSKNFLSFAEGKSSRHSSFISLSLIIATIIEELHRCLSLALLSENNGMLLTQILKCYAVLCENTPYCKLKDDILLKLLKQVKGFLHHKDTQVQVAALIVFQFIVKSDQIPETISNIIISPSFDAAIDNLGQVNLNQFISTISEETESPWLIYVCKKNIFSDEPLPIRIESVQLLSCIVGKYFHKILSCLFILEEIILYCLNNLDCSLQLHGAKLLDVFGRCVFNATKLKESEKHYSAVKNLWQNVINGPFIKSVTGCQKSLLTVCCDCLSTIPADVFEILPEKQQIFYVTVLLGLAADSHPNVRGAAIRCLGVYCLFPNLSKDFSFLSDVSEILVKSVNDSCINVRFKASWSLGKLSDALFENKSSSCIQYQISENFFYSSAMACVQYSKDCDKVRANSVRALGIFLYHLQQELIKSPKMQPFVKSASLVLQSALTANTMKVCWNACYALSKMLQNTELLQNNVIELEDVLVSLLNSLKSPNFKVRISAAHALTVMESREFYGKLFTIVWFQLIEALNSTSNDVNFKEIKHQENLLDQLCYSLCRLSSLFTLNDLSTISQETLESSEILFTSMWRFGLNTSSDKVEKVCNAIEHLNILNIQSEGNIQVLSVLQDIFNQVAIAFYGQDMS